MPNDSRKQKRRLADISLTAQADGVDLQLRTFLPRQRYLRIETALAPGLNRIDDASMMVSLEHAARQTIAGHSEVLDRLVDLLSRHLEFVAA
jgi:hypothetical protein